MKKILITVIFIHLGMVYTLSQNPTLEWAFGIGGKLNDFGSSVKVDNNGNVYYAGKIRDTVDADPGTGIFNLVSKGDVDILLSKLDSSKNLIWAKSIGSQGNDGVRDITLDNSNNIIAIGHFRDTVDFDPGSNSYLLSASLDYSSFIWKLNTNGDFVWAKQIDPSNILSHIYFRSIDSDPLGNLYITGEFEGTGDFNPGAGTHFLSSNGLNDVCILKLDSNGNFLWAHNLGGPNNDIGSDISVDNLGHCYITGNYRNTVDFDPDTSTYYLSSNGYEDVFFLKLDSVGSFLWAKGIGSSSSDGGFASSVAPNGNIVFSGYYSDSLINSLGGVPIYLPTYGSGDFFIANFSPNGDLYWIKGIGGPSADFAVSMDHDNFGNFYLTGYFQDSIDHDPSSNSSYSHAIGLFDMFVSKYDPHGNFIWATSYGIPSDQAKTYAHAIEVDMLNNFYVTCAYGGNIDFDPGPGNETLTSNGVIDIAVIKFKQCQQSHNTIFENTCFDYLSPSGNHIWYTSGIYHDTIYNANGCDSIIAIDLTITNIDTTLTQIGNELFANTSGASYQWLDCNYGNIQIPGATNQSFTPIQAGIYACVISKNGCIDTTYCYSISTIGIEESTASSKIKVYPNPANEKLFVDLGNKWEWEWDSKSRHHWKHIEILNAQGQVVLQKEIGKEKIVEVDVKQLVAGEYFVRVMKGKEQIYIEKFIKE